LMDVFKQFANKNIVECVKDGFPDAYFVVWIRKLHNRPSMTMSLSQSQVGTTCKPQIN
jgi:hypothetical protein